MLHGEPAWLFGAVHSLGELKLGPVRLSAAGLVPTTRPLAYVIETA